jgi:hypothetical protein
MECEEARSEKRTLRGMTEKTEESLRDLSVQVAFSVQQ